MTYISLDQLLAPQQARTEDVHTSIGTVKIKSLMKAEQQELRRRAMVGGQIDQDRLELHLVAASLVEPELPVARVMELRNVDSATVEAIIAAALRLNRMTPEAAQEAEATFQG